MTSLTTLDPNTTMSPIKGLPDPEIIVEEVLKREKDEEQALLSQGEDLFVEDLTTKDSQWEAQKESYLKIEQWVRKHRDQLPSWEVAGPLNYGMTLEEMSGVITEKFRAMVVSGHLITDKQLRERHYRNTFYPETERGNSNLTRIWGAEYLKRIFTDDSNLGVAEHFLIVDDSASEIEVQVWHGNYPSISTLTNGHILSQKIEGIGQASRYSPSSVLKEAGYRDFADPGNIIRDSQGMGWVVDTEMKSFDAPQLDRNSSRVQDYLRKRFRVLFGEENYHTFKIPISALYPT